MPCAKIAWNVITLPKEMGGLGIIDSWALLGKYVVRALSPQGAPR